MLMFWICAKEEKENNKREKMVSKYIGGTLEGDKERGDISVMVESFKMSFLSYYLIINDHHKTQTKIETSNTVHQGVGQQEKVWREGEKEGRERKRLHTNCSGV